jgi:hypothetical protein
VIGVVEGPLRSVSPAARSASGLLRRRHRASGEDALAPQGLVVAVEDLGDGRGVVGELGQVAAGPEVKPLCPRASPTPLSQVLAGVF